MPLINPTYFQQGKLFIPNTEKEDVNKDLSLFILEYEEKFLREVFGYGLYSDFLTGISANPIDQKWLNLLYGCDYFYYGSRRRWNGLIAMPAGVTAVIDNNNTLEITVGEDEEYDPVAGVASMQIPPNFSGVPVTLVRRGIGPLKSTEFSISGTTLSLVGSVFDQDEVFFLSKGTSIQISSLSNVSPTSIIANYIYCFWLESKVSEMTGVGMVRNKTDNAISVSPDAKICKAWNDMVDGVRELDVFLTLNAFDYPSRNVYSRTSDVFHYRNVFGI